MTMNTVFGREYLNSWIAVEKTYKNLLSRLSGVFSR